MSTLSDKHVRQVEQVTEDLKRIKLKIGLLADLQGLSPGQADAVESLRRGIDSVRGCELGLVRQMFGLDQDVVAWNQQLRRGGSKK